MHTTRFLTAAGLLAAIGLSAPSASATIARDGAVNANAAARVNGVVVFATPDSASWSGVPADLSAGAVALNQGRASVQVRGGISAQWASADQGLVRITDHGWSVDARNPGVTEIGTDLSSVAPDWTYAFQADGDGTFDLAFNLFGSGVTSGLSTWNLLFAEDDAPGHLTFLSRTFPDGDFDLSGGFSHALRTGHRYRVSLLNQEGFFDSLLRQRLYNASESGTFDWSITTITPPAGVPEPSTWTLSILGFALAGAALRRRSPLRA